jgi:hypothetical protein
LKGKLARPGRIWEDNIKMYLKEIGFEDEYWIHVAMNRDQLQALLNMIMILRNYVIT